MRYCKTIILVIIISAITCLPVRAELTIEELFFDDSKAFHLKILDAIPEQGIIQIGNNNAKNTIIEFMDYFCGYCKKVHVELLQIAQERSDTRIIFLQHPILSESSKLLANMVVAANMQDKGLDLHNALFGIEGNLNNEKLQQIIEELEINSAKLNIDMSKEEVTNIVIKKTLFAHKLVEESMLLANESAAEFMQERLDLGVYRIHEDPDPSKLETLKKHFKIPTQIAKKLSPLEVINRCLQEAHNKKDDTGQILVLQTLARAEYSTNNLGHFGLQLKKYSHFTSPIRRYPDLLVHRLINSSLAHKKPGIRQNELQDECENSSMLERRAEKASRQVEQVLICSYLKTKIGSTMDGVITGVTDFGLFVNLEPYFISGLLHVSDLPDDRYQFLQDRSALKGKRRGGIYKLGQKIKVKIAAIFPLERKINLVISNGK